MSGQDHRAKITSGRAPDIDARTDRASGPRLVKVYGWECSCGAISRGTFPTATAAEQDHDDHLLAALED